MANFHTDLFVVVANNSDMLKVLGAVAANLSVHEDETGFSETLEGVERAEDAFELLEPVMDPWYEYVFTPYPIGSDEWKAAHAGYEAREMQNGSGVGSLLGALAQWASSANLGEGVSIGLSVEPSGRPLSETATVRMEMLGDLYYLSMHYSTAFASNLSDIDEFFEKLPSGDYGFAFLDADEADEYQEVGVLAGTAHGGESLSEVGSNLIDAGDVQDIFTWVQENCRRNLAVEKDLAQHALLYGAHEWTRLTDTLEALYDLENPDSDRWDLPDGVFEAWCEERVCSISLPGFTAVGGGSHWDTSADSPSDLRALFDCGEMDWSVSPSLIMPQIRRMLVHCLEQFPYECEATGQQYQDREPNIEGLAPNAPVILESDWKSPHFDTVGIGVLNQDGQSLGNLGGSFIPPDNMRVLLACLLPHITAYAIDVEPLSMRSARCHHSRFNLHLEIGPVNYSDLLEEICELFKQDPAKRVRRSVVGTGR